MRGLALSSDPELRRLVTEGLREAMANDSEMSSWRIGHEAGMEVVLYDELASADEDTVKYILKNARIVIGTDDLAGRGADYLGNRTDSSAADFRQFKHGILELNDVNNVDTSSMVQKGGRVQRYAGAEYQRVFSGEVSVVDNAVAAAYRSDRRALLIEAGEARAKNMSNEDRYRAFRDADGNASGFELLKTKRFEELTYSERIRVAAWDKMMANTSQGMLTNGPGLVEHMFLKGPLQMLARSLSEGSGDYRW